ncbi:hypothetical protein ACFPTO_01590 [Paraburkholderia denitrificans]|uniref:Uncharacterized protein n=1 Tax=Paraburkholderia denitrificans TaxID=694025 RepID=A0ABW0J3C2_9BURK
MRAVAVWVAAMWVSTAAVAAGQVKEVWNPPEARHVSLRAGTHGAQAHTAHAVSAVYARHSGAQAVAHGERGHGAKAGHRATVKTHALARHAQPATTARHAASHASAAHASAQHAHRAHAVAAHSTRQAALASPAHSAHAHASTASMAKHARTKPAVAHPAPRPKLMVQAQPAAAATAQHAAMPQSIQPMQQTQPQSLPPMLR